MAETWRWAPHTLLVFWAMLAHASAPLDAESRPPVDSDHWYRLSNAYLGEDRILEVPATDHQRVVMGRKGKSPGQFWRIVETEEKGWYCLYNQSTDYGAALGTDPDSGEMAMVALAPDSSTPALQWRLVALEGGCYRLTGRTLGEGSSLDTYSDGGNAPFMGETGDYSGQCWRLTPAGSASADGAGAAEHGTRAAGGSSRKLSPADYMALTRGGPRADQASGERRQGGPSPVGGPNLADRVAPGQIQNGEAGREASEGPATGTAESPGGITKARSSTTTPGSTGSAPTAPNRFFSTMRGATTGANSWSSTSTTLGPELPRNRFPTSTPPAATTCWTAFCGSTVVQENCRERATGKTGGRRAGG